MIFLLNLNLNLNLMPNTYVAIMAGGIGSRFWPASRAERPKQFLNILGTGKSLLRMTFERFLHVCPAENIYVVTNARYRDLVKEHLPELGDQQILGEPSRNNTAPCVAYTAFKLHALNPEANLVVAPSDHIILQEAEFIRQVKKGLAFTAKNKALLTLGIQPSRPDTGYGYIELGAVAQNGIHRVASFREKPDRETAQAYLDSGQYLWNAGIFIWKVEHLLAAFQQYAPEIYRILGAGSDTYNTPREQEFVDAAYPTTPNISIDYAIMEKATNVYTLPSDFGWSDLGTWASLHAELPKDEHGNAVAGDRIYLTDTHNSLIRTPAGKQVVITGLDDFIVVDEGDTLLIHPKSREQEIKSMVQKLDNG